MNRTAELIRTAAISKPNEPSVWVLLFIFWSAFAGAAALMSFMQPDMFVRQDPDSLMHLVQVRDLLGGQGWFDLVQHRLDPPRGVLMHFSRLIDAPLAGLVLVGNLFGDGETLALTAWPLLLLLGLMASALMVATALAGPAAALPTLILSLVFLDPLLTYLPNDIDHHNAQVATLIAVLACAMRLRTNPLLGLAAGFGAALMLAIGLEMLPYVGLIGAVIALQWAISGQGARGTAFFGLSFALAPAALQLLTGPPQAAWACDSISYAYAIPAAVGGFGLAGLTLIPADRSALTRLLGVAVLGLVAAALFATVTPACMGGPYGAMTPELKALWLDTVTEAQPLLRYVTRDPGGTIAAVGPPVLALIIAIRRLRLRTGEARHLWLLPTTLIATALLLSLYQVRTLPFANAVSMPVLGAWLAEVAIRHGITSLRPLRKAMPLIAAFFIAMPVVHLVLGEAAVHALSLAIGGRVAPIARADAPKTMVENMSAAEKDCLEPASGALLAQVPNGLVVSPVFYGSTVLALSTQAVVGAPYHRADSAIVPVITALNGTPASAETIFRVRGVDYVAICSASQESAIIQEEAPAGLLAQLLSGVTFTWLEPIPPAEPTALRLWRITH